MKKREIILGIDPGTVITGYGIIESTGGKIVPLDYGAITPPKKLELPARYLIIHEAIEKLIDTFSPTAVSIETQFVGKNVQSAIKLGMARGVAILAAAKRKIPIFEYAPKKAKAAVVGSGTASKMQVQKMIQMLLSLSEIPQPEDAADGLALAICHAQQWKKPC